MGAAARLANKDAAQICIDIHSVSTDEKQMVSDQSSCVANALLGIPIAE